MQTYLFYDIETTGLNRAFDQVLQFAAIRTDPELNELERHEIIVKLRPDVVPSPGAMIAHCIPISRTRSGVCEFEATAQIHALLNEPNTISLGYNTLGFDDEFLRFAFHRNLLPPYRHQYANNCRRMDLLPMVTMYYLYKSEVLEWPRVDDRVSLKLEYLKEINSLTDGVPHDALTDVLASVELARRLARERDVWNYLASHFDKGQDIRRIRRLTRFSDRLPKHYTFGLLVSSDIGWQRNYQAPVLFLGHSIPYKDHTLWLRLDLPELRQTTPETIREHTWVVKKKYGEPGIILPPEPRFMERIDEERRAILRENQSWLEQHPDLLDAIARHHREFAYPEIPDVDADAALYQMGFLSDRDQERCRRFHRATLAERIEMIETFDHPVMRELAQRVLLRNYREHLPERFEPAFRRLMQRVNPLPLEGTMIDYRGRERLTPEAALREIKRLKREEALDELQIRVLDELEPYLRERFGG